MSTNIDSYYKKLLAKTKDLIVLQTAQGVIQWDMETKMPPKAVEQRSLQLALLSRLNHQMSTDPEIGILLKQIMTSPEYESCNQIEKRNVYLIKRNYDEQTALPEELVEEKTKQQAITVNTWKKAKKARDFALLKPELEKLVNLSKQEAEFLKKVKETPTPYDALIDSNEPKMTAEQITPTFNRLQQGLEPLLQKIQSSDKQPDMNTIHVTIPVESQQKIATVLAETLGYDVTSSNAAGRIDETEHPFTEGYYDDVRITTHYYPNDFTSSIFSVLHETGHALYDQNLNPEWKYQPIGSHTSMGIHESQSRFAENIVGRSKEFWTNTLPKLKQVAPEIRNIELEPFIHAINSVKPSKIRIESDEVTYNLHIIIRFQIEQALFANEVNVNELPQIWNQKYKELLGLSIENDSEGVMQDTHWPSGLFGYFPSYSLGNIYSGQFLAKIKEDVPDWNKQLNEGNLTGIMTWLKNNVHSQSNLYDPADLIKKITGDQLDAKPYLEYLEEKYSQLYDF
ncbi:MAG TPA: carboxypeptidase M32 [Candidatus Sulfotelmatobacter sp.]|nr:carboxypeptidase M32 [Candidatus Sulfotelmatobacter sp.]